MILDATCGPKLMYHGLHKQFASEEMIFIDIRKGTFPITVWGVKPVVVEPNILADLKRLPFRPSTFTLVIFDPPQMQKGLDGWLTPKYGGRSLKDYRTMPVWANIEFHRVLTDEGYLLAKTISLEDRDYYTRRAFTNFKALLDIHYRSKGKKLTSPNVTHWILYVKSPASTPR